MPNKSTNRVVFLGAQRILTGTTNFYVRRGEELTVTGYYKHCLNSVRCPTCIRQVYLNLFTRSVCLASLSKSHLDCKEHHFSRKFTAPDTAGSYDIKMEEKLAYKCVINRRSSSGSTVGTVVIEEPPSIVNKTSTPTVFIGDSLLLSCSASGYPPPVVHWYKDGSFFHKNTSLMFPTLNQSDSGLFMCNASNIAGSDTFQVQVLVRERRPILQQRVLAQNADHLLANDSVTFTVILSHGSLSRDHAWNIVLVWILPHYARFLSHVPKTNITNPYPGEYQIELSKIEWISSVEINITVRIDPDRKLPAGVHFLSIPTYIMYEKRKPGDATEMFTGSIEAVTVNFTVNEGTPRGFLMHPLSNKVYLCKGKKSNVDPSCYVSTDGVQWNGIDQRVKIILGMLVRGLEKKIFAKTSDDQSHLVSEDGSIWKCIVSEKWKEESSSADFVHAISIPRHVKYETPQDPFISSNRDGTVFYGGSARGLHRKEKNGAWRLVALWDCP